MCQPGGLSERHRLPRLSQGEAEGVTRPATATEIATATQALPANGRPGCDGATATGELRQALGEGLALARRELPQGAAERERPGVLCAATVALRPKPDKDAPRKELQADITDEHRCKNSQQNSSKQNPTTY